MLEVENALKIILENCRALPPGPVPLFQALNLVLAEDAVSDLDMPPFDKALMDGYALRSQDLPEGQGILTVIEEISAGMTPTKTVCPGQAVRIMTGSPIPPGADAVVMIERTRLLENERVQVEDSRLKPRQNILEKSREMRLGAVVVRRGTRLRPEELGVLATVGRVQVQAHPRPRVALIPTGDEIVEPSQKPGPGQIRNGSGMMIQGQVARAGGIPQFLGIARDNLESLGTLIQAGLHADVLVLMGGVSAGKKDMVPGVLADHGVEALFHKIAMKPGKPLLFGLKRGAHTTLVFGLPGNPVSSLVCFELFVRPALRALGGHANPGPPWVVADLQADFPYKTDRPTYFPARLQCLGSRLVVQPVPWFGSADLRGVLAGNAYVKLPVGDHHHRAGTPMQVLPTEPEALAAGKD